MIVKDSVYFCHLPLVCLKDYYRCWINHQEGEVCCFASSEKSPQNWPNSWSHLEVLQIHHIVDPAVGSGVHGPHSAEGVGPAIHDGTMTQHLKGAEFLTCDDCDRIDLSWKMAKHDCWTTKCPTGIRFWMWCHLLKCFKDLVGCSCVAADRTVRIWFNCCIYTSNMCIV